MHQNLALVEDLTVWQNLFLNREKTIGFGPFRAAGPPRHETRGRRAWSRRWRSTCLPSRRGSADSRVASGRRYPSAAQPASARKLVIMDEPTAALGVQETAKVEELIRKLRDDGHAVLLISHNFEQVLRLSDQVWVMRAGRCIGGRRTAETTGEEIVGLITGAIAA